MANLQSVDIKISQLVSHNGQLLAVDKEGKIWSLDQETEGFTTRHTWREWSFPFLKVQTPRDMEEKMAASVTQQAAIERGLPRNF